ncbi:MAG: AAA family ATPase [Thermoplasmata archaeon]|nr:AAA family ATPase [Thermoplasmata archaeon]
MRLVPMGIKNFPKMREAGLLYVDKTFVIDRILSQNNIEVFLFTRPRRFGKTLNLSMLDAYFNQAYKGKAEAWFDGLEVMNRRPNDPNMSAYPVISITLKDLAVGSYDSFLKSFRYEVSDVVGRYPYLADSMNLDETDRDLLQSLRRGDADDECLARSIKSLSNMLKAHHGKGVILLIDEYDNAVNNAYGMPHQAKILEFLKRVLGLALKDNDSLKFAVVTGIMQIAKEGIFSGLNNAFTDNIFSTGFDDAFGFTEDEVRAMCAEAEAPEKMDEIRQWYDGYRFGEKDVYNPWSVLSYFQNGLKPAVYWGGTSGNDIIDNLLSRVTPEEYVELARLNVDSKPVVKDVDPLVTYADISSSTDALYQIMAMSGYLKAIPTPGGYELSIPNLETMMVFSKHALAKVRPGDDRIFTEAVNAVTSLDEAASESKIREVLMYCDFKVLGTEHVYQMFMYMLFCGRCRTHVPHMEGMNGDGYYDLYLESIDSDYSNIMIEFKALKGFRSRGVLEKEALKALKQIEEKDYTHGMTNVGTLGIAFNGKKVAVKKG